MKNKENCMLHFAFEEINSNGVNCIRHEYWTKTAWDRKNSLKEVESYTPRPEYVCYEYPCEV